MIARRMMAAAAAVLEDATAFAPITVRGTPTTNTSTSTSIILSNPTGIVAGDVLIAFLEFQGSSSVAWTAPAQWTTILNQAGTVGIFWHVYANGDAASWTFGNTGINHTLTGTMLALTNVNTTTLIDGTVANNTDGSNVATHTAPSKTPSQANNAVIGFSGGNANTSYTWSTPMTKESEARVTNSIYQCGSSVGLVVQTNAQAVSPTATTGVACTNTNVSFCINHA